MSNKRLVVKWGLRAACNSAGDIAKLFARIVSEVPHVELLQITPQRGNGCTLWARLPAEDGSDAVVLGLVVAALGLPPSGVNSRIETDSECQGLVTQLQQLALDAPALKAGPIWQAALRISQDEHTIAQLRARLMALSRGRLSGALVDSPHETADV
jgi:hypothetical protein